MVIGNIINESLKWKFLRVTLQRIHSNWSSSPVFEIRIQILIFWSRLEEGTDAIPDLDIVGFSR